MEKKKMKARLKKYKEGEVLSGVLYHLTTENPIHRAYKVKEILDACDALGFHPSDVGNERIGFILSWLKENKG
ncbi:MAG: hypothetical protein KAW45_05070 [Thermoplasmatales archaeon]|nr:hypothetical protein [Thermoplasmatales archaeon]